MKMITTLIAVSILFGRAAWGANPKQTLVGSACGSDRIKYNTEKAQEHPALGIKDGSALVYVISRLDFGGIPVGCQVVTRIGLDGKWVGANCGSSYLSASVPAGEHHLCADWQSTVFLSSRPSPALDSFRAEAGKTYYFQAKAVYMEGSTTIELAPLNSDEGKLLLASERASVSSPKK